MLKAARRDKMNATAELQGLYFHDSLLRTIAVSFSDGNRKSCLLDIDYYDWEGNKERRSLDPKSSWQWRRLQIAFGYLAHIEFSAPDLINRAQDIDTLEIGFGLTAFRKAYDTFKQDFPRGRYPLFENGAEAISLRFSTQNHSDSSSGFLWVVGTEVELKWLSSNRLEGQIHIPVADA
jgi:hypothetical protein